MPESGLIRRKRVPFTQVSNHCLHNPNISLTAKGLYSLIQSLITNSDFKVYKTVLQRDYCKEGRDAFNNAWKELKNAGYLKVYRINTKSGFVYEYDLLDVPEVRSEPSESNNFSKALHADVPSLQKQTVCSDSPHTDFPYVGSPHVGNPSANNTYISNNVVVEEKKEEPKPEPTEKEDLSDAISDRHFDPTIFDCHDEPDPEYIAKYENPWNTKETIIAGWQEQQRRHNIFGTHFDLPAVSDNVFNLKTEHLDSLYCFDEADIKTWHAAKKLLLRVMKTFVEKDEVDLINNATLDQIERVGEVAFKLCSGEIEYKSKTGYLASSIRRVFGIK